ncbi:hypothetical protein [Paludisphaera soli]|uniref:hypothetical protein n=1 Tax=Paludisphaera soli TaxID=2712865 RepID=UPI0013EE0712|nr:hypothetical protein [Paludisphaera soli]
MDARTGASMVRDESHYEVFEWLGEGLSPSPPAYLRLLGPGGGGRGDHLLANLATVAGRLRERPGYWGELIRARNWRPTLVGCSAALLARDLRFLDDLLDRFKRGSWVAPQLAVALGLLHPAEAAVELEGVMRQQSDSAGLKAVFSAYAVLKQMGSRATQEFEASDLFRQIQSERPGTSAPAYDWLVVVQVVHRQWDFWKETKLP